MNLNELVFQHHDELNENDISIWNYIANHKQECETLSIEALAKKCLVSRTTILRFSRKIGLGGYSDLKYLLREELHNKPFLNEQSVHSICDQYAYTIHILENTDFSEVCRTLFEAERVFAYGQGFFVKSGMQILKEGMFKADLIINLLNGPGEMNTFIHNARSSDTVIIFSVSGENTETIRYAERILQKNLKLIVITANADSTLAKSANMVLNFAPLVTQDLKDNYEFFPISSFVFLIELLYYKYCLYCQDQNS